MRSTAGEASALTAGKRQIAGAGRATLRKSAGDRAKLRARLLHDGFARIDAGAIGASPVRAKVARALSRAAADLPQDPYCPDGYRFRRYGRLYYLPWTDLIVPGPPLSAASAPVYPYQQPSTLNSEEGGAARLFPAIPGAILASDWMQHILRFDLDLLEFSDTEQAAPIQVGVHLVELRPRRNVSAVASPNRVHRDGEHYTCAHLIERRGVTGGENHIVDLEWADREIGVVPPSGIRSAFTLEQPLEGFVVRDDRIAHHVGGVDLDPAEDTGSRTILLTDFTPLQPAMLVDASVDVTGKLAARPPIQ